MLILAALKSGLESLAILILDNNFMKLGFFLLRNR